ncbi:MAG TPA: response regulator [Synergistales bacterium]|nr:response regulator [Synergistales bacterium]HRV70910.1 response regulator [Thermovirgaceae bacterium]
MTFFLGALDDDPGILYTLEAMASSQGWNMKTTTNPSEALDWVKNDSVDMLLLDLHMPVMSGLEVLREARKISSDAVLLVLTVEESPDVARDLHIAGADDFISKPVRLADFASRIALHAELGRYRREGRREQPRKGLSEEITRKVLDTVKKSNIPVDAKTVAVKVGISYPTAHRYLEFLTSRGSLARSSLNVDGKPGRPRSLYQAISGE